MTYQLLWVLLLLPLAHAFSRGAPLAVCFNMTPQHHAPVQTSQSPFVVQATPTQLRPGDSVTVRLIAPEDRNFKGFYVQGRRKTDNSVVGSFVENNESQTIDCSDQINSAGTHKSSSNKSELAIQWIAPRDFQGNVIFRTTFVENGKTFWVDVTPSDEVQVAGTPDPIQVAKEEPKPFSSVYDGCFTTKGCFGGPINCIDQRRCLQLVTYAPNGSKFNFEIIADTKGWAGVGFSNDLGMGGDTVTVCSLNGSNTRVSAFQAYNVEGKKDNEVLENMRQGLSNIYGEYVDGFIYCRFTHEPIHVINDKLQFDFRNNSYYLFLARGSMASVMPPVKLNYHSKAPYQSATKADLSEVSQLGLASNVLVKLHGSLMVVAWIGTVSLAIFLARYFKQTWSEVVHCKQKVWFTWHRSLNIITVLLTIAGFIVIFVYLEGWSQIWTVNPHPILGVITTALVIIQPIMAAFRCHPGTTNRPIFNWAHFLVGNSAHILAVITLFFAKPLQKANLPDFYMWILIAFVAFHVIVFFTMEAFTCFKGKTIRGNQIAMKDMTSNGNAYHINDQNADAPGSRFRKFMLSLYIFGNVCFVIALIATIVVSPVKDH